MSWSLADLQPKLLTAFQTILAEDRLSHAYLFSGGFGADELAIYLAQSRFCEQLTDDRLPCGSCRACRLVASGEFADVTILEPSGQVIKTEQVRELAKDFARSSFEGTSQVFIIKEADKMHVNAANSLLKQIEEPNSHYYVFLLTSDESKVLPTIKSRCQVFRLVTDRAFLQAQFEAAGLLKNQASVLAQLTNNPQDIDTLANHKKLLEMIRLGQQFLETLPSYPDRAYLQASRLGTWITDKSEQDLCWQILTVLAAQPTLKVQSLAMLQKIHEARGMWLSNVSFHNALDYLVLTI